MKKLLSSLMLLSFILLFSVSAFADEDYYDSWSVNLTVNSVDQVGVPVSSKAFVEILVDGEYEFLPEYDTNSLGRATTWNISFGWSNNPNVHGDLQGWHSMTNSPLGDVSPWATPWQYTSITTTTHTHVRTRTL